MAGQLTKKHSINSATEFVDSVQSTNTSYFMFTGRSEPWDNEESPPETNTSVSAIEHTIHDHLLYGKRLTSNDVKFMAPRHDWVSNTVYSSYDSDDAELFSKNFFVITDQRNVYKILDNNKGGRSTVKPVLTNNTVFKTSDDYVWKYMYTVDDTTMRDFATRAFIPITPNTNIQQSALPGSIDVIKVQSGGLGWITYHTGFLQSVPSSTELIISANASTNSNFYTNSSIYLKNGLGAGQIGKIISYNGTTKNIVLNTPLNFAYNIEVANIAGQFNVGDIVSQQAYDITLTRVTGSIDVGDTITQSVTGATGVIARSRNNGTRLLVNRLTGAFDLDYPVDAGDAPVTGTGTVTANTTSNTVTGSGTNFTTLFPTASLPHYIKIGNYTRQITSVTNATSLIISGSTSGGFDDVYSANVYYKIPSAGTASEISSVIGSGTIVFSDLNSVSLTVANKNNKTFIVGETVFQPDSASNGTIIFANNTILILSNIQGPGFRSSNSSSVNILISGNTSPFTNNEIIIQNTSNARGTITFANSSYMSLTGVTGTFSNTAGYFITGQSSTTNAIVNQVLTTIFTVGGASSDATANVVTVYQRPTITIEDTIGQFKVGAQIAGAIGGTARVKSVSTLPDEDTEYIISPTVQITGDGRGAQAYSVVNTSTNQIQSIVVFDPGQGYTEANATIVANSVYGSSANLKPTIAPINGHGYDPVEDLGGNYVMVKSVFGTANSEGFEFPSYGTYRTVGLMRDPLFKDVTVNLSLSNGEFSHGSMTVNNIVGTFQTQEIVYQANTKSSAIIEFKTSQGSNNYFEISRIQGQFSANNANDKIIGLLSGASANVRFADVNRFTKYTGIQPIFQQNTGAKAILTSSSDQFIRLTNATGIFEIGKIIYDPSTNTYANSISFKLAGNTKPTTFTKFTQLGRITLSSNSIPFSNNERIELRANLLNTKIADAVIYSTIDDIDLQISGNTTPFSNNETIIQTVTNARGTIKSSNSTMMKIVGVSGVFTNAGTTTVVGQTSSSTCNIERVYPVLVVNDMDGLWATNDVNYIFGLTSNAIGYAALANTIILPELVRDSGDVLYIENREYIERTPTTSETVRLLIRF